MKPFGPKAAISAVAIGAVGIILPSPAFGAAAEADGQDGANSRSDEIVVLGQRGMTDVLENLQPEDELNEDDIAAYGVDSVGDLLEQIATEVDDSDDGPVVLVNGQLATGVDEITDLPTEAVSRIQLLPREAAARLGQGQERRVINVVIKRNHRQLTANAERTWATAGKGTSLDASAGYTLLRNGNRSSLTVRLRETDPLLESDRSVSPSLTGVPYDLVGNIVPLPLSAAEIDPALSALVGSIVQVAGIPSGNENPALSDIAALAGQPNIAGAGRYRTLVAGAKTWSINGTLSRRLAPRTNLTINARGELGERRSLYGAPSVLLRLPAASPFSPFSNDVGIARFLDQPIRNTRDSDKLTLGAAVNHGLGKFNLSLNATYTYRSDSYRTLRNVDLASLQEGVNSGEINPFALLPRTSSIGLSPDSGRSASDKAEANITLSGPAFILPAGPVSTTLRLGGLLDRQDSRTLFGQNSTARKLSRDEVSGQFSIGLPIANRKQDVLAPLGDLRLSFNAGFRDASVVGTLASHGYGFNWQPTPVLTLRGSISHDETPPSLQSLSDPVEVTEGVRFFDFIRGESVDVTIISGGNPDLANEKRRTVNLGANYQPFGSRRLTLTTDYTQTRSRNAISGLPPLSAIIQAAFSDRFHRDADGILNLVDSRPVSFDRDDREQLRLGLTFVQPFGPVRQIKGRRLGGTTTPVADDDGDTEAGAPLPVSTGPRAWRLDLNLSHSWTLKAQRVIHPGLPVIDLLNGGAVGFGGGQPRHGAQGSIGISGQGMGLRLTGRWKGETVIRAGELPSAADLRFASRLSLNLRLFGNLGTLMPETAWAKGARLTLATDNLFDSKQRVADGNGITPLRYQPYLIDPMGRTITLALRKAF